MPSEGMISQLSAAWSRELRATAHSEGTIDMHFEGMISHSASWPCELRANVHSEGTINLSASGPCGLRADVQSKGMISQAASVVAKDLSTTQAHSHATAGPRKCSLKYNAP